MKIQILFFLFIGFLISVPEGWGRELRMIVNSTNPVTSITRDQLQDYYFKRNRVWPDGRSIRFFDRAENSTLRDSFLNQYIRRTSRQVDQFWIAQKFNTGDSAPTQIPSDSLTMSLVSRFPGGIGYVDPETKLEGNVKAIEVEGP